MRYARLVVVVLVLLSGFAFGASGLREARGRTHQRQQAKALSALVERPGWTSFDGYECCAGTPLRLQDERARQMRRAGNDRPPFAFGGLRAGRAR